MVSTQSMTSSMRPALAAATECRFVQQSGRNTLSSHVMQCSGVRLYAYASETWNIPLDEEQTEGEAPLKLRTLQTSH